MQIQGEEYPYSSQYCEENIYHLAARKITIGSSHSKYFVVFVTSKSRHTPLWYQKKCYGDKPVLWDYHVFLFSCYEALSPQIYDMDSTMPCPVSAIEYMKYAIRYDMHMKDEYEQYFRVIPAHLYVEYFSSDRCHMKDSLGGWVASPPAWSVIKGPLATCPHSLPQYWELPARERGRDRSAEREDEFAFLLGQREYEKDDVR